MVALCVSRLALAAVRVAVLLRAVDPVRAPVGAAVVSVLLLVAALLALVAALLCTLSVLSTRTAFV